MLYLEYELYELSDLVWIRWNYDSWVLTWGEHDVCMGWFMGLKWWVWYSFDMRHEWGWINECGMVSVGNTLLHLWLVKDEWNGFNMEYKWGWIVKVDMIYTLQKIMYITMFLIRQLIKIVAFCSIIRQFDNGHNVYV